VTEVSLTLPSSHHPAREKDRVLLLAECKEELGKGLCRDWEETDSAEGAVERASPARRAVLLGANSSACIRKDCNLQKTATIKRLLPAEDNH
jgi:hypothetical protein